MIGLKQSIISSVSSCTYDSSAGVMRDASGAAWFLFATNTRVSGWSQEWALGTSGLACAESTFNLIKFGMAITSGYKSGCWTDVAGHDHQLKVDLGAVLPGDPPPPPPPPPK